MPEPRDWHTTDPREIAERENCSACLGQRAHTPEENLAHPCAGHGFTKETGWTHPLIDPKVAK